MRPPRADALFRCLGTSGPKVEENGLNGQKRQDAHAGCPALRSEARGGEMKFVCARSRLEDPRKDTVSVSGAVEEPKAPTNETLVDRQGVGDPDSVLSRPLK